MKRRSYTGSPGYVGHHSPDSERAEDWRTLSKCADDAAVVDAALNVDVVFFPIGDTFTAEQRVEAEAFCGGCPVKAQCLEYGRTERLWGTWGGVQSWEWGRGYGPAGERAQHGTVAAYQAHRKNGDVPVKCVPCAKAWAEYQADYAARKAEAAA